MKPLNVLHVIAAMDPKHGGVASALKTIIDGLNRHCLHNEVVSLDPQDASYLNDASFTVHAMGPAANPWRYSKKLIPWLNENLTRFDIIILHGLWLYNSYAIEKALRLFRKKLPPTNKKVVIPKLFVMPHGMLDPYFQRASNRKLKALRNWIYWKLIEHRVVNKSDGLLFTCEEEKRLAGLPFSPYKPKREIIVGLGIDEPPVYVEKMKAAFLKKCPLLFNNSYHLFLSRVHEKKGVDMLIDAYVELYGNAAGEVAFHTGKSYLPGMEIPKLVIAGPNLESLFGQKIQNVVSQNPLLKELIYFTGMLSGDAKWGAFYGCEAFILPSHQENFGIAIVEALACSKPVLISNQVNIWREIMSSGGGSVAEDTLKGTRNLLVSWQRLSSNEKVTMQRDARRSFEKYFSINASVSRIINAFNS